VEPCRDLFGFRSGTAWSRRTCRPSGTWLPSAVGKASKFPNFDEFAKTLDSRRELQTIVNCDVGIVAAEVTSPGNIRAVNF